MANPPKRKQSTPFNSKIFDIIRRTEGSLHFFYYLQQIVYVSLNDNQICYLW